MQYTQATQMQLVGHTTLPARAASDDTWRIEMKCVFLGPTVLLAVHVLVTPHTFYQSSYCATQSAHSAFNRSVQPSRLIISYFLTVTLHKLALDTDMFR